MQLSPPFWFSWKWPIFIQTIWLVWLRWFWYQMKEHKNCNNLLEVDFWFSLLHFCNIRLYFFKVWGLISRDLDLWWQWPLVGQRSLTSAISWNFDLWRLTSTSGFIAARKQQNSQLWTALECDLINSEGYFFRILKALFVLFPAMYNKSF